MMIMVLMMVFDEERTDGRTENGERCASTM